MDSDRRNRLALRPTLLPALVVLASLGFWASPSFADWGDLWGQMTWGQSAIAVPLFHSMWIQGFMSALILLSGIAVLRKQRRAAGWLFVVALMVPVAAKASQISLPYTFVNGTPADATEVNDNFGTIVQESNAQDLRIGALESQVGSSGDITGVSAGVGLTGGGLSGDVSLGVDTATIQSRVSGTCAAGSSIRAVAANGTVTCEADDGFSLGTGDGRYLNSGFSDTMNGNLTVTGTVSAASGTVAIFSDGAGQFANGQTFFYNDGAAAFGGGDTFLYNDGAAAFANWVSVGNYLSVTNQLTVGGYLDVFGNLNVGASGFGNVTFNLTERTGDDFLAYFRNAALTNVWYVSDTGFTWSNSGASFTTVEIRGGADIAEPFDIQGSEAIAPGLVVAIDPERPGGLRLATSEYDHRVAGVVSGAGGVEAGLTLRQEGTAADGTRPVALTGRVYTWVDADANGPIEPGDLLTTSGVAGHAMKATDPERRSGAVLGKAMTGLASGRGLVLALVTLQ